MAAKLGLVLDCADADKLAEFWSAAIGYTMLGGAGSYVLLVDDTGQRPKLLLQRVDEPKAGKNRRSHYRRRPGVPNGDVPPEPPGQGLQDRQPGRGVRRAAGHRVEARDGVARDRGAQLRRLDLALRPRGDRPVADDGDADVRLVSGPAPGARVPPFPAVRAGPPQQLAAAPVRPRRLSVAALIGGRPARRAQILPRSRIRRVLRM